MRKYYCILFFITGTICSTYGQITFQKTFPTIGQIERTIDGCFLAYGYAYTPLDTMGDLYVTMIDCNYDTVWSTLFGFQGSDRGGLLVQNSDSDYFLGGSDAISALNYYDFIIYKFDRNGNIIWVKNFGTIHQEDLFDMTANYSEGVIMAGMTSTSKGYIANIDSGGNFLWTRIMYFGNMSRITGICKTADQNYVVVGNIGAGDQIFLAKLNQSGNLFWCKVYDSPLHLWTSSVETTTDSGFIIGAYAIELTGNDHDFLIIKTDSLGNVTWSNEYGGDRTEGVPEVIQTQDGGYLAASYSYSFWFMNPEPDGYAVKLDANGDTMWTRVYGDQGVNGLSRPLQTDDHGYMFVSYMQSVRTIIKTDSMGYSGCRENVTSTHINNFPLTEYFQTPLIDSGGTVEVDTIHVSYYQANPSYYCLSDNTNEFRLDGSMKVFPVPATEQITFSGLKEDGLLEIYSVTGEKCLEIFFKAGHGELQLSVADFSPGFYFGHVTYQSGQSAVLKLIRQ